MNNAQGNGINYAFYDEAVTRYAELACPRALAVYRLGEIDEPGRDLADFLVVTDRSSIDNRHFFNARERLPERFHAILGETFILPAWSIRAIRYIRPRRRALLSGRDVLHPYSSDTDASERWCRLLETFCKHTFILEGEQGPGRERELQLGKMRLDEELAELSDLVTVAAVASYREAVTQLENELTPHLGGATTQERIDAARAILQGDRPFEHIDPEYVARRSRDIDGYFQELASMGFPYGSLFPFAAYPRAVRALPEPQVVTNLVRRYYSLRRRLFAGT